MKGTRHREGCVYRGVTTKRHTRLERRKRRRRRDDNVDGEHDDAGEEGRRGTGGGRQREGMRREERKGRRDLTGVEGDGDEERRKQSAWCLLAQVRIS